MGTSKPTGFERTYDVGPTETVPDLEDLPGVRQVAPPTDLAEVVTYFDTADLRLLSAGVTLHRRTGGVDNGWHLELPGRSARDEVREFRVATDGDAPAALLARVRVILRDAPIMPSAVLTVRRRVHRMLDSGNNVLAELRDERVTAETTSSSPTHEQWREWEFVVVNGPGDLLEAAEPILLGQGARASVMAPKLSRALAEGLPARPTWRAPAALGTEPRIEHLLSSYLGEHFSRLEEQDQLLRTGGQESVHQLRVAARRLRSALATYSAVLQRDATTELRSELRWLGGVLAGARDAQVLSTGLRNLVDLEPDELVVGPVLGRVDEELGAKHRAGLADAAAALDSERYFRLLDRLEAFLTTIPLNDLGTGATRAALTRLLAADLRRLRTRHRAYQRAMSDEQRDRALHDVRKAAKRLRYAAESATPALGERATKLATRAAALQELLGEHQDTVIAKHALLDIGARAHAAGENAFTFGVLHAREEERAAQVERDYPRVLARLPRGDLDAWLAR